MPTVRHFVDDADAGLPFCRATGAKRADRRGLPFAIAKRESPAGGLTGPGTPARQQLGDGSARAEGGGNRGVAEAPGPKKALPASARLGVRFRRQPVMGPGGSQVLPKGRSGIPVETFQTRVEPD